MTLLVKQNGVFFLENFIRKSGGRKLTERINSQLRVEAEQFDPQRVNVFLNLMRHGRRRGPGVPEVTPRLQLFHLLSDKLRPNYA